MKPSDYCTFPWDSVLGKAEAEQVAVNIMIILKRTGDTWRELSWDEYEKERMKDGHFSNAEQGYFNRVIGYCSKEKAASFSQAWKSKQNESIPS